MPGLQKQSNAEGIITACDLEENNSNRRNRILGKPRGQRGLRKNSTLDLSLGHTSSSRIKVLGSWETLRLQRCLNLALFHKLPSIHCGRVSWGRLLGDGMKLDSQPLSFQERQRLRDPSGHGFILLHPVIKGSQNNKGQEK